MSEYTVKNLRSDLNAASDEAKNYVEFGGMYLEIIGSRVKQNGGAMIYSLDETSEHHARERLGEYTNTVHKIERRNET